MRSPRLLKLQLGTFQTAWEQEERDKRSEQTPGGVRWWTPIRFKISTAVVARIYLALQAKGRQTGMGAPKLKKLEWGKGSEGTGPEERR